MAEYAYGERLTDKADVYSFGVVLLEMLTRRRPTSEIFAEEGTSLPRWVRSAFPENLMAVIDPVLLEEATQLLLLVFIVRRVPAAANQFSNPCLLSKLLGSVRTTRLDMVQR